MSRHLLSFLTIFTLILVFGVVSLFGASVNVSWNPNGEGDLAGYQVYVGTASQTYTRIINVPGPATEKLITGLGEEQTHYFAVTAYDESGNESAYSLEQALYVRDKTAPTITSVTCPSADQVVVVFSEPVDRNSAEITTNYIIDQNIIVQTATLQSDNKTVYLSTLSHIAGSYTIQISNVRDVASLPNTIAANSSETYTFSVSDTQAPMASQAELFPYETVVISFNEDLNPTIAEQISNYSITPSISISSVSYDAQADKVYLYTSAHTPGVSYQCNVYNIQDVAGNVMANTQLGYDCLSSDTQAPTFVAVRSLNATQLELEFGEALNSGTAQSISNYSIRNAVTSDIINITGATYNASAYKVILYTATHQKGTYVITVSNVQDLAGNAMSANQLTYSYVPPDVTRPTLVGNQLSSDQLLKVYFSEKLDAVSATSVGNYQITCTSNTGITIDVSVASLFSDSIVYLETSPHVSGTYELLVSNVDDAAGNQIGSNAITTYSYTPPDQIKPTLQNAVLHGANMVELTFSEAISPQAAENENNYSIQGITVVTASLAGQEGKVVYLNTTNHTPGNSYTVIVNNIPDLENNMIAANSSRNYNYPVNDQITPQITNADLTGTQNLTLTYSEPVSRSTAEASANYQISPSVAIQKVTLDISSQVVTILTNAHTPGQSYHITVSNVRDLAGNAIQTGVGDSKSYNCVSVDNAPPVLQYARSKGMYLVELCFDEVLDETSAQNAANYTINKGIAVTEAEISRSGKEVYLKTSQHQYTGEYEVTVQNIQDIASPPHTMAQKITPYYYMATDTTAPVLVNASLSGNNILVLQFNEALNPETASQISNYRIGDGTTINIDKVIFDYSLNTVYLQTSEHLATGTYSVHVENIQDVISPDNTMDPIDKSYVYTKVDNTGPVLQSAECTNGDLVVVHFDESLELISARNKENYSITPDVTIHEILFYPGQSQVMLQTSEQAAGTYKVTVHGVKDDTENQNEIVAYSNVEYTWNPADSTAPALIGRELIRNTGLKLYFSEPISADGIEDTSHYQIRPKVEVTHAMQSASDLKVIYLYTTPHPEGQYTLTVNGLTDRALNANTIDPENSSIQYAYTLPDIRPPAVDTVMCRQAGFLVVQFDEKVDRTSAENTSHYRINGGALSISQITLSSDLQTVHLETERHQGNVDYTLSVTGVKDRADTPNQMAGTQSIVYQYLPPDDKPPTIAGAKYISSNEVRVQFSEAVEQASAENRNNYQIQESMEVSKVTLDSSGIRVTITTSTPHYPIFSYRVIINNVKDLAGNTIAANSWKGYSVTTGSTAGMADNAAPELMRVEMASSTQLTLVFSEGLNKTAAENVDNYFIADSVDIKKAELDSNGTRVYLTTSAHRFLQGYSVQVTGMKDRASTPNIMSGGKSMAYIYASGVGLSALSQSDYEFNAARAGTQVYVDRYYELKSLPDALSDALMIQTANNDKQSLDPAHLSFELSGDGNVYVAYDAQIDTVPEWLSTWKPTGDYVMNSRDDIFNLYSKSFSNSLVVLGGNEAITSDDDMYSVFVRPYSTGSALIASLNKTSYSTLHLEIGDAYYSDRSYQLYSLPDSLENLLWIQTANEDKTVDADDFLQFEITARSKIYIAYDARVKARNLPEWLDDSWEFYEGGQIVDNRGDKFNIHIKEFDAGQVTLGGNCGTVDDNMYLVLIQQTDFHDPYKIAKMPGYFTLSQNYPNPFNPETRIRFTVHKPGRMTLTIYNLLGQRVKVLVDKEIDEFGLADEVVWDGTNQFGIPVASGIYFYRVKQHHFVKTRKMLLVR